MKKNYLLPERVYQSMLEGKLVIFAGAGVSMPDPTNLPSFRQLVKSIAHGTGYVIEDAEPEDVFIGRLHSSGIDVHSEAASILGASCLRHNKLHEAIVGAFGDIQRIRIVTTNYDRMFEEAVAKLYKYQPKVYVAPALPLGSDFKGIVHIHGVVDEVESIIISDGDLGNAYISRAFATRFLIDLFASFDIVFIGYSYNDTVVRYLTRALPVHADFERFIIVPSSEKYGSDYYQRLGLTAIYYDPVDNHSKLIDLTTRFREWTTRKDEEWLKILTEIAKKPPSYNEVDERQVLMSVNKPGLLKLFLEMTNDSAWLDWFDEKSLLSELFNPLLDSLSDRSLQFANWIISKFAIEKSHLIFDLIYKYENKISPVFATLILIAAAAAEQIKKGVFIRFFVVLYPFMGNDMIVQSQLMEKLSSSELYYHAWSVFRDLIRPRFELNSSLTSSMSGKKYLVEAMIRQPLNQLDVLKYLWDTHILPNIHHMSLAMICDVTMWLIETEEHWIVIEKDEAVWFAANGYANYIEQDLSWHSLQGVLFSIGQAAIMSMQAYEPDFVTGWAKTSLASSTPSLARLGLFALKQCTHIPANKKISLILDRFDLFDWEAKFEIFDAVGSCFRFLEDKEKEKLVNKIMSETFEDREHIPERTLNYAKFNWLEWLNKNDPNQQMILNAIDSIKTIYPDFQGRSDPRRSVYSGRAFWQQSLSPIAVEKLINLSMLEFDNLVAGLDEEAVVSGIDRRGLYRIIVDTIALDTSWYFSLVNHVISQEIQDELIWEYLLPTSSSLDLDEGFINVLLDILNKPEIIENRVQNLTRFVLGVALNDNISLSKSTSIALTKFIRKIWQSKGNAPDEDLTGSARLFNSTEWNLLYSVVRINLPLSDDDQNIAGKKLTSFIKDIYSDIHCESDENTIFAICYFFSLICVTDYDWAVKCILPFFNDPRDRIKLSAWQGFLVNGHLNQLSAEALNSVFGEMIRELHKLDEDLRSKFVQQYVLYSIHGLKDPFASFLPPLIAETDDVLLPEIAKVILAYLKSIEVSQIEHFWKNWLETYWSYRNSGKMKKFTTAESAEMLNILFVDHWLLEHATSYYVKMPPPERVSDFIIKKMLDEDYCERFPMIIKSLLTHIEPGLKFHQLGRFKEVVRKLLSYIPSERSSLEHMFLKRGLTLEN